MDMTSVSIKPVSEMGQHVVATV